MNGKWSRTSRDELSRAKRAKNRASSIIAELIGSTLPLGPPPVPLRAYVLSTVALAIPVANFVLPGIRIEHHELLLWLLALVPAFLLAYYRGWRGVALALAAGMALMVSVQVGAQLGGVALPGGALLISVVVAYIVISLAVGFLAELLHRERARAVELALTDELTGLPNRRFARFFLDKEFAAGRRGRDLVVVLFDIDRFKEFNDSFGHEAGDAALVSFADVLTTLTRRMNLSARYGGEEFVSILSSSDVPGAVIYARKVCTMLRESAPAERALTVSAGIAAYRPEMGSFEELLAGADEALYEAKAGGRDRIRVFGIAEGAQPDESASPGHGRVAGPAADPDPSRAARV